MSYPIDNPATANPAMKAAVRALAHPKLTEDTIFHVSPAGDDNNDGSALSPWATQQQAANALGDIDLNGYDATVQLGDGSHEGAAFAGLSSSRANAAGFVCQTIGVGVQSACIIRGNPDDPTAVTITPRGDGSLMRFGESACVAYALANLTEDYSASPVDSAINGVTNTLLFIGDGSGGTVRILGSSDVGGDAFNTWGKSTIWVYDTLYLDGKMDFAFLLQEATTLYVEGITEFGPDAAFAAFANVRQNSLAFWDGGTSFVGSFVGSRFSVDGVGSSLDTRGVGSGSGLTTIPGSLAGGVSGGGSYISDTVRLRDFSYVPIADPSALGEMFTVGAPSTGVPKALMISGG